MEKTYRLLAGFPGEITGASLKQRDRLDGLGTESAGFPGEITGPH